MTDYDGLLAIAAYCDQQSVEATADLDYAEEGLREYQARIYEAQHRLDHLARMAALARKIAGERQALVARPEQA